MPYFMGPAQEIGHSWGFEMGREGRWKWVVRKAL
jgi:hypothetical protein